MPETTGQARRSRLGTVVVVVAIVALSINLRPAVVSVSAVLDEIREGLSLGGFEAGLLTAIPVLCFASVGAAAPRLAARFGLHRVTLAGLVLLTGSLWARAHAGSAALFLVLTFLAVAGIAMSNVLLPSLVRLHFPDRVGLLTAIYSTALAVGLSAGSGLTVPLSEVDGVIDWRHGIVLWTLVAAVAVVPWIGLVGKDRGVRTAAPGPGILAVARTRLGWWMAVFFGLQSLQAYAIFGWFATVYRGVGFDAEAAGNYLAVITAVGIPLSFVIPWLTARFADPRPLLTLIMACYPVGYLGLIFIPTAAPVVWAVLIGIGTCTFPYILTLFALRARTPTGTAALSGFAQSVGYLISAAGPLGMGLLHDLTGGWTVPLWVLLLLVVPQYVSGMLASRPAHIEDELPSVPGAPASVSRRREEQG